MSIEEILSRLSKARKTGNGQWMACCPAHNDKSPSLGVKETPDGRVLIHCFGGCDVESVLDAIGLTFDDLYPEKSIGNHASIKRPFPTTDILRMIAKEALIVAATAKTIGERELTDTEKKRAIDSAALIQGALSASGIEVKW